MFREIMRQAWTSLRRQPVRSCLTMTGIVWGIVAVTMLLASHALAAGPLAASQPGFTILDPLAATFL